MVIQNAIYIHLDSSNSVLKQLATTYNELGLHSMNNKNYKEALSFFNDAHNYNQNDSAIHLNKGDCYMKIKDLNKSLQEYTLCLKLDPSYAEAAARCGIIYYKYAIISFNTSDYQDCIHNIDSAIKFYSHSPEFYVLRAKAFLKLKNVKQAFADALHALELNPYHKDALEIKKFLT